MIKVKNWAINLKTRERSENSFISSDASKLIIAGRDFESSDSTDESFEIYLATKVMS